MPLHFFFRVKNMPSYEEGVMGAHHYVAVLGSNPILYFFSAYYDERSGLYGNYGNGNTSFEWNNSKGNG